MAGIRRSSVVATCVVAVSCAPAAQRVEMPAPVASAGWSRPLAATVGGEPLADLLGSPELGRLIDEAYEASPALLAADARVAEANALARAARTAGLPVVGASTAATLHHGAFDFGGSAVAFDAAYTPDLGGERRARARAAKARATATAQDRDALRIAAAAEIARLHVQRAALTRRLALVDQSIAQSTKLERVVGLRVREGESSRVELGLQSIRVRRLRAERLRLNGALDQARAAMAVLLGQEAPIFHAVPADLDGFGEPHPRAPSPATLVATRPDLRAAEARLRAAGGDVAVARAAFFPRLDLSVGLVGRAVLSGGTSLGAALLAPIFNRATLRGQYQAVSAAQRAAALDYRQAVLAALAEVETALAASATAQERARVLGELRAEAATTADLARRRYLEGEAGIQELLDAQDLLVSAEDAEVLAHEERLEAAIALWRATATGAPST